MRAIIPQHQKPDFILHLALLVQGGSVLIAAILVCLVYGQASAAATGFGGFVALANSGLLTWRMRAAKRCDDSDAQRDLRMVYRTGLERFALVVFFLALGMGVLKFDPAVMIAGFVLGQLAWLIGVAIKPGRTH